MARLAFGMDAHRLGDPEEICCAPRCESPSILAGADLPLCEAHMITAYRRIGEYLRSKNIPSEEAQDTERGNTALERLLAVYEIIGHPHGVCPKCEWLTLCRHRETNDVICMNTSECGFSATAEEFLVIFDQRVEAYREDEEVVYYVRFGDRVKIGTTRNLASRLASIPHDEVLATEPGGVYVERQRHKQFKHLRTKVGNSREWFDLTPELVEHIAALKARQAA